MVQSVYRQCTDSIQTIYSQYDENRAQSINRSFLRGINNKNTSFGLIIAVLSNRQGDQLG